MGGERPSEERRTYLRRPRRCVHDQVRHGAENEVDHAGAGELNSSNRRSFCVVAHRGDCAHAPENTLPAFELAVQKKADAIETDVRLTKDGVAVLLHDASLKKTTGCDELVENLIWEEGRKLDAG